MMPDEIKQEDSLEKTSPTSAQPPTAAVDSTSNQSSDQLNKKRNSLMYWISAIILIIGITWFVLWLLYFRFYQSTDDAYVRGNLVNVTTVISGTPIAFFCDNTDLVKKGQLLVQLDDTYYRIEYNRQKANLADTILKVKQLYDSVNENIANVENKRIAMEKAGYDYNNRSKLIDSKAITNQDFSHSRDDFNMAILSLKQAEYQLSMAKDLAGNTPIEKHPLIEIAKNELRTAFYQLKHCSIYAPATGYVAKRNVEVGQWVSPSSAMLAIIPIDYIWVDANFKETQLNNMRIGQPAKVHIDLYGSSVEFEGKVAGIESGTGSVFSLIPPQNATGNWIKIVQRLPVRIILDQETLKKHPLRLGLSSYVTVDISNTDGPVLAPYPVKKTIASTNVFDLNLNEVEEAIERILQENILNTGK